MFWCMSLWCCLGNHGRRSCIFTAVILRPHYLIIVYFRTNSRQQNTLSSARKLRNFSYKPIHRTTTNLTDNNTYKRPRPLPGPINRPVRPNRRKHHPTRTKPTHSPTTIKKYAWFGRLARMASISSSRGKSTANRPPHQAHKHIHTHTHANIHTRARGQAGFGVRGLFNGRRSRRGVI